jgi:hypothetical protein
MQSELVYIGIIVGVVLLVPTMLYCICLTKLVERTEFVKRYSFVVLVVHSVVIISLVYAGWQMEEFALRRRNLETVHQDTSLLVWVVIWALPTLVQMGRVRRRFKERARAEINESE